MPQCLPTSLTLSQSSYNGLQGPKWPWLPFRPLLFSPILWHRGHQPPGLLVLSWTLQEHLKPPSQQCGSLLQILARATPSLLWISAKMSHSSPHHYGLPCLCCLIFPCSSRYHDFYIFHQCSIFICLLSDSPLLPNNTLEYKLLRVNRIFLCFVRCCLSSTWDDTWSMSDRKVFVEWLCGWSFL